MCCVYLTFFGAEKRKVSCHSELSENPTVVCLVSEVPSAKHVKRVWKISRLFRKTRTYARSSELCRVLMKLWECHHEREMKIAKNAKNFVSLSLARLWEQHEFLVWWKLHANSIRIKKNYLETFLKFSTLTLPSSFFVDTHTRHNAWHVCLPVCVEWRKK